MLASHVRLMVGEGSGVQETDPHRPIPELSLSPPAQHKLGNHPNTNDQCENIIMEEADAVAEIIHVDKALGSCG